ncbi:MAG: phosphoglycerate kinase [Nanoarchaeota archaeon]|nr:phosphoglycerate kinase [Nanoarchaeota archaeon]MBU4300138.1 phosphoglycerate kinase [Nanoarchaeota archaeon]MBU4451578.1 phosphoglycerate kinase [Nanoarchaeota archaeon]MCG2724344.1 phosphoglycerate kinase [archaeon]
MKLKKPNLKGKNVFHKVDMNSSFDKNTGQFKDISKIREAALSIKYALDCGARTVIVASHQGDRDKAESLKNHVEVLQLHLPQERITFAGKRCGDDIAEMVKNARDGEIIVLENTRLEDEEWAAPHPTQTKMYSMLKKIPDLNAIKDDPASHRKELCSFTILEHLSSEGVPVYGGPLLHNDVKMAAKACAMLEKKGGILLIGGRKLADQLELIPQILEKFPKTDALLGGLLSVHMEKALGKNLGPNNELLRDKDNLKSDETEMLKKAVEIMNKFKGRIVLPQDYFIKTDDTLLNVPVNEIHNGKVIDIGIKTIIDYKRRIEARRKTSVMINGAMGHYESAKFMTGPGFVGGAEVYSAAFDIENKHFVMCFGGDSTAIVNKLGFVPNMHSSSGKAFFKRIVYGPHFDCKFIFQNNGCNGNNKNGVNGNKGVDANKKIQKTTD